MNVVVFESFSETGEVHEPKLACNCLEECVFLVDRLEGNEGCLWETDRCDHHRKPAARTDVEHTVELSEVRNHVKAVLEVFDEITTGGGGRQVDAAIPFLEEVQK